MKYGGWSLITTYQNLKYGERYWTSCGDAFRYRCEPMPGIHHNRPSHWGIRFYRSQSMAEKRQWYDYEYQFKDAGFTVRRRRVAANFLNPWDDEWPRNSYRGSWKQSTKKRRQWGGCTEVVYCG